MDANERELTDFQLRLIKPDGTCLICEGTHYGAQNCPYKCPKCGVNTNPCADPDCQRKD